MRCPSETREGAELLLAYSSRKLDAERSALLADHVRSCAVCGAFAETQESLIKAMELWEAPPVSADFDQRLYRRIGQDSRWWELLVRPFRPVLGARWLPMAAAAGLLLVVGLWIERPGMLPAPEPAPAQIGALPPEQAEHALQEMEIMQEFNRLVRQDPAEPRM